jgi:transcription antitermination factor NusG
MTWYAIRTMPGAQMPQREYAVETTESRKGYRIVPSLNPTMSAVERALSDAGFVHYMPAEKRLIRDRKKAGTFKARRIPLLQGYVFIKGPCNFLELENTPGVAGIVGTAGRPLQIDLVDILLLRTKEATAEAEFDREAVARQKKIRWNAKKNGDKALVDLIDSLKNTGTTTVTVDATRLVA